MTIYKCLFAGSIVSVGLMIGQIVWAEVPVLDNSANYSVAGSRYAENNYYSDEEPIAPPDSVSYQPVDSNALLLSKIEELQREIQTLRGQIEVQAHDLKLLNQRQEAFYKDLDQRVAQLTTTPGGSKVPQALAKNTNPTPAKSTSVALSDKSISPAKTPASLGIPVNEKKEKMPILRNNNDQESYTLAYEFIRQRQFPDAIEAMNEFIKRFPDSQYTSNAHYWLGELYLTDNQAEKAIIEFTTVLQRYPESTKIPASMLKLGYAYQQVGKLDLARAELQKVRQQYPNSSAANLADTRLREISQTS